MLKGRINDVDRRINGDARRTRPDLAGSSFALISAGSLFVLSVYSEADHPGIGIFRIAVTQLN